jgi:hypothetical protein
MFENLTWTCHICGKKRPDAAISVFIKPLIIDGQIMGNQNIRYCNDNPDCIKKVKDFSFIKGDPNGR